MPNEKLFKFREVADMLGLHYQTINRYAFQCRNCYKWLPRHPETKNVCECLEPVTYFKPINVSDHDLFRQRDWRIPESQIETFLKARRY